MHPLPLIEDEARRGRVLLVAGTDQTNATREPFIRHEKIGRRLTLCVPAEQEAMRNFWQPDELLQHWRPAPAPPADHAIGASKSQPQPVLQE